MGSERETSVGWDWELGVVRDKRRGRGIETKKVVQYIYFSVS